MELSQKNISIIKRYPTETLVFLQGAAIVFLGTWILKLDSKIDSLQLETKTFLQQDHRQMVEALNRNTAVLETIKTFHLVEKEK